MTFKVLIVGLGKIGLQYDYYLDPANFIFTHSNAFSQHPGFELVGGVDNNIKNRTLFSEKFNAPTFNSLEEALNQINPEIIVIATPSDSHLTFIKIALTLASPKLILCEKPLSIFAQEAENIVRICSKANVPLFVNYIRRADPAVIEVKRRLDAGIIQRPYKGSIYYTKGFIHNASHFFDLFRFWFGPMTSFSVFKEKKIQLPDKKIDCNVEFSNASMTFINAEDDNLSYWGVDFFATNGRLSYSNDKNYITWEEKSSINEQDNNFKKFLPAEIIHTNRSIYQLKVAQEIFAYLNGGNTSLSTGSEALETLFEINKIMGK
jgi:predicted dehydrogenase